jgi:hypothetical protein
LASGRVPSGKPHLTVMHFGRPVELYRSIGEAADQRLPSLPVFLSELRAVVIPCVTALGPARCPVIGPSTLNRPPAGTPVDVLLIDYPTAHRAARERLWARFCSLLRAYGVVDPEAFAEANDDLRFAAPGRWMPHVTIGPSTTSIPTPFRWPGSDVAIQQATGRGPLLSS